MPSGLPTLWPARWLGAATAQTGRRTVTELLEEWMMHLEGQGRAASRLVRYRSAINTNIVPRLGNVDITKLEPAQIDAFYAKLWASGLTPLSVRNIVAVHQGA